MIEGVISKNRPLIPITISWKSGVQEILALIDTGFTGELKLPREKVSELGLDFTHTAHVQLADNSKIDMLASIASVSMEGTKNTVGVLIGEGMPTIGVGLLKRFKYTLTADFKDNILNLERKKE